MLSLLTGMRAGEIAALRVEKVIDNDGQVRDQIQLAAAQTKGSEAPFKNSGSLRQFGRQNNALNQLLSSALNFS